jgi:hypothetical protein
VKKFRINKLNADSYRLIALSGALNTIEFRAARNLTWFMAEGEGFEPPFPGRKAVFKTAALNHSAIPPSLTVFDCFSFYHSSASLSTTRHGFPSF